MTALSLAELDALPDGAALLDELHAALTRYVILPSEEAADAVTCWIAATHAQSAFEHATRLAVVSPVKRCGKSRLLDVIEATCHAPLITVNISPAALVRSISEEDPPTLMLDEADTIFTGQAKGDERAEALRGIINAGHGRNRPYIRWDAGRRIPEECPTFAMCALASIGALPDTIMDRAIAVKMRRRSEAEVVAPFRVRRDGPALADLRGRVAAWMTRHVGELREAVPELPVEDRAADTWEPVVAVADLAGGTWPERIRRACTALVSDADLDDSEASLSLRLLEDIRDVFTAAGDPPALFGDAILGQLRAIEWAPWSDMAGGSNPLTIRRLARMLLQYQVRPLTVRIGQNTRRGYRRADLADAWSRYLRPQTATEANAQVSGAADLLHFTGQTATSQVSGLPDRNIAGQGQGSGPAQASLAVTGRSLTCDSAAEPVLRCTSPREARPGSAYFNDGHLDGCPQDHERYGEHGHPCSTGGGQ